MIVGISGKIGCGKSTVAKMLVELLGSSWLQMSLGDEVKKEAAETFGFPLELAYSQTGKETMVSLEYFDSSDVKMSVRQILQYWGTDVRRKNEQEYWLKKLVANLLPGKNVVIDDVRFVSEVEFIKERGGVVFRLNQYPGYEPPATGKDHISETELDDFPGFDLIFTPGLGKLGMVAGAIAKNLRWRRW